MPKLNIVKYQNWQILKMDAKELENIKDKLKELRYEDLIKDNSILLVREIKKESIRLMKNAKLKERKIEEKIGREIIHSFKGAFTKEDITAKFKDYPENEVIKALRKLVKDKKIDKIGRSLYSTHTNEHEPIVRLSDEIEELSHIFNENGIIFIITGLDILQEYLNLIPKRILHLIYVVKGSGESAKELVEKRLGKISILNPSRKEVRNLFTHYSEDIIIIREVGESSIEYHKEGIAMIEKAIVDLYFETTRKRIPFEISELAYILRNTLPKVKVDYTRLLRAASRRNIQSEFIRILNALEVRLPYEKTEEATNDKVEKVIRMLR